MQYIADHKTFNISYQELRELYHKFIQMDDTEFMANLPEAIHFACVMCYFKEIPTESCLIDTGIIHELVHLLKEIGTPVNSVAEIRLLFAKVLRLD